jgi:cytochrome c oxidase subunit III
MPTSTLPQSTGRGGNNGAGSFGRHGRQPGNMGANPERVYVTGMIIALGGILMFFMALTSAWVVRRGLGAADWESVRWPPVLWLDTLILAASSATLARSRRYLAAGRRADYRHWWGVTTILGVLFLVGQLLAWRQMSNAGLFIASSAPSSFFYVFTAAHGLHVLGGIAALLLIAFDSSRRLGLETASRVVALYWHFLGAIWVLIFALLLLEG